MDGCIDVPKKFFEAAEEETCGGKYSNEIYLNLKIKNHICVSLQVELQQMNSAAS
jgi:hypothetical protein